MRKRLGHKKISSTLLYAEKTDRAADDEIRTWRRAPPYPIDPHHAVHKGRYPGEAWPGPGRADNGETRSSTTEPALLPALGRGGPDPRPAAGPDPGAPSRRAAGPAGRHHRPRGSSPGLYAEAASHEDMVDAILDALTNGDLRAAAAFVDMAMSQAMGRGSLALYAREGVQAVDW